MGDKSELSSKNPPFAIESQITAIEVIQRDVTPAVDLRDVFVQS
jgi:hypothetical protein